MTKVLVLCLAGLMASAACVRDQSGLTSAGLGKPELSLTFPAEVRAGTTHVAQLEVANPGPGDLRVLSVTFVLVGPGPNQDELPRPLILGGANKSTGEILSVSPEPRSVSSDGLVYSFAGLSEGESAEISFDIRVPHIPGTFANSVQVHDGQDLERLTGVRLDTVVER